MYNISAYIDDIEMPGEINFNKAVEEMENTTWEHLRQGLGVGNPFVSQIIRVRGSLSGTYEKSRIILPLYFKNIDKP